MLSTDRSVRNLMILVVGIMMGCILAYLGHYTSFLIITTAAYLLPFIIALLVGVAKTTTV